jgi:hypothetical protein
VVCVIAGGFVSHVVSSRSVQNSGINIGDHESSKSLTSRFTNFETIRTAVGLSLAIYVHRLSRQYGENEDRCRADVRV